MELGDHLKDPKEFRREFEEFKKRMERNRIAEATSHRGYYLCRMSLSEIMRGSPAPLFRAILVQNSIDFNLSDDDSVHLQGQNSIDFNLSDYDSCTCKARRLYVDRMVQAAGRGQNVAGNIILRYKRILSPNNALDLCAVFGMQTVLCVTSTTTGSIRHAEFNSTLDLSAFFNPPSFPPPPSHLVQAALRGQNGAGNIILGYKRILSPNNALDLSAVFGMQTVLSVSSTQQLDPFSSGTLTTSWTPSDGFGMQASTMRQLSKRTTGTLNWVVGPPSASGMSLSLQRRGTKHVLSGKLEVGLVSSISAHVSYSVAEAMSVRAVARLGTSGVDLEVGANKRWSPEASGYLGALIGMQGVVVKMKFIRGSQTFDIPISVSQRYDHWRVVAAAYVLPPLAYLAASRFIIRPMNTWARL
eukprot:gene30690-35717_t